MHPRGRPSRGSFTSGPTGWLATGCPLVLSRWQFWQSTWISPLGKPLLGPPWGMWQTEHCPSMTGLWRETALAASFCMEAWQTWHRSFWLALTRWGWAEACGTWQAMHFPSTTGGWGWAAFAEEATDSWQVKQSWGEACPRENGLEDEAGGVARVAGPLGHRRVGVGLEHAALVRAVRVVAGEAEPRAERRSPCGPRVDP